MKVIIGSPASTSIITEFLPVKNLALLVAPTMAARNALVESHKEILAFHEVNEARIIEIESLSIALKSMKPKIVFVDNVQWLLRRLLALPAETYLAAVSVDLSHSKDGAVVLPPKRKAHK